MTAKKRSTHSVVPDEAYNLRALMEVRNAWHTALFKRRSVIATAIGLYRFHADDKTEFVPRKDNAAVRTLFNSKERRGESWPCVLVFVRSWSPLRKIAQEGQSSADPYGGLLQAVPAYLEYQGLAVPTCVISVSLDDSALNPRTPPDILGPDNLYGGGSALFTQVQQMDHFGTVSCLASDGERVYALTAGHILGKEGQNVFPRSRSADRSIGKTTNKTIRHAPLSEIFPEYSFENTMSTLDAGLIEIEDLNEWTSTLYQMGNLGAVYDGDVDLSLLGKRVKGFGARSHAVWGEIVGLFPVYKSLAGQYYSGHLLVGPRYQESSAPGKEPLPFMNAAGDSGMLYVLDPEDGERAESGLKPLAINWGVLDVVAQDCHLHFSLATMCNIVCRELDIDIVTTHNAGFGPVWGCANHRTIADLVLAGLCQGNSKLDAFLSADHSDEVNFRTLATIPDCWSNPQTASRLFPGVQGLYRSGEGPNHYCDIDRKTGKILKGTLNQRIGNVFGQMIDYAKQKKDLDKFYCAAGALIHYCADACNPAHVSIYAKGHESWPDKNKFHQEWDNARIGDEIAEKLKAGKKTAGINTAKEAESEALAVLRNTLKTLDATRFVVEKSGDVKDYETAITEVRTFTRSAKGQTALAKCIVPACELWYRLVASAWKLGGAEKYSKAGLVEMKFDNVMDNILTDPSFLALASAGNVQKNKRGKK